MRSKKPVLGYILKGYPRISETFISNEILRLEQQGFRIIIFPMRKPRESFSHDSVKQITAEVHYLPTYLFRNILQLLPPNIMLAAKYPSTYWRTIGFALKRFRRTFKIATFKHLFQAGYMVEKIINKGCTLDHLHGHFAHSPTSVTMFAAMLADLPFSFTAHAKDIYTSQQHQLREKIEMAKFVVTCTGYNANYLKKIAGKTSTPIYRVYHGIDTSLFQSPGARVGCTPPYKLLTVARMTEKKGLPTLYQALAKLRDKKIAFHHILIGDGDDRDKILSLINKLRLDEHCSWLGTQTHAEVLQHFRQSDLFILSCQIAENGDRDGIPNVLVESLAMGVPAISTNVSAIPELIKDNVTGKIISPDNSDEMAEAIETLLQDGFLREKLIDEGQRLVHQSFDNTRLTAELGDIFLKHSPLQITSQDSFTSTQ